MVSIGVVGTGGWGKNHLRVLAQLDCLAAFCDIDPDRVKHYSKVHAVPGFLNVDEMIANTRLDGIVIATPTSTHYELAMKSLEAGIHTFVEKPLTNESKTGKKLILLAEERGLTLAVGYIERFNPAVQHLRELLDRNRYGPLILLELHRENRWPERVIDIGIVMDTSVHDIDTARWLFGSDPETAYARTGSLRGSREDFATIILGFGGGRTAFIFSNWVTPKRVRQASAVCAEGIISVDFINQKLQIDHEMGSIIPRIDPKEPLQLEMINFISSIETGSPPLVTGRDALKNTIVAEAILESSAKGEAVRLAGYI